MPENKSNNLFTDVGAFFSRLQGKDRLKTSDKGLTVLNSPTTPQEKLAKQKITTLSQYIRNKNWNRRHVEYFDEYRRMVATYPLVKSAIDIYGSNAIQIDPLTKNVISVKSDNKKVKDLLEQCFFKNLNINNRGYLIVRELCKFGNVFAYIVTRAKDGVVDLVFLPPENILREQMYNPEALDEYRFSWYGHGGGAQFEPWELVHWKNSEDIEMEPYGVSVLRPIVDTWRRVILIREALVVYRLTRAPSKLLFKIGTDGMTGEEAYRFAQEMKKEVDKKPYVNPQTGELDFKYSPLPVHKNTPIPLLNKKTLTIEQLAKEYEQGKTNYVYSIQDNTNQIVPGKVVWCGKNYVANKLIKVWLDNESYISTAPEHPFVLRDGTSKRADELKEGDSLMPFYQDYKQLCKGFREYHQTYNPATNKYEFTHRLIAKEIEKSNPNFNTVHHLDFDRLNNSPENLQWMDFQEHREFHKSLASSLNKKRNSYLAMLPYVRSQEHRERASKMFSNVNQSRKENINIHEEWVDAITANFDDYIWKKIEAAILSNKIKNVFDASQFVNSTPSLIQRLNELNQRQKINITHMFLNRKVKQIGYKSFGFFVKSVLKKDTCLNPVFLQLYKEVRLLNLKTLAEIVHYVNKIQNEKTYSEKAFLNILLERGFKSFERYIVVMLNKKATSRIKFSEFVWNQLNKQILKNNISSCIEAARYLNTTTEILNNIKSTSNRETIDNITSGTIRYKIKNQGFKSIKNYINFVKTQNVNSSTTETKQLLVINHKVSKIEIIENCQEDVYCMTVVGLNGEEDRHNFACLGKSFDGSWSNSGVFVKNSVTESFFVPVYEGSPSDIEVLEGAANLDQVEDYKIIKDDLFIGLKIPKSFLTMEEDLSNRAALTEESVQFGHSISRIQQQFIEGLVHIGVVHLFLNGCSEKEMQSFTIEMNNPSTLSEKRLLELVQARLEVAKMQWDFNNPGLNLLSYTDVLRTTLKLSEEEIKQTIKNQFTEKKLHWRLTQLAEAGTYQDPELEKQLAELKRLGDTPEKPISGFDGINFEGDTLTEMVKKRIEKEIKEMFPNASGSADKRLINTIKRGMLAQNIQQMKEDIED